MPTIKTSLQAGLVIALAATALLPGSAQAQTCPDPVAADFRVDTLSYNDTATFAHVAATGGIDTLPGGRRRGDLYENNNANGGESGSYGVVQIATAPDGKVFVGKMCSGQVRVWLPSRGLRSRTIWAGTVPTRCNNEDGLLGIVLAPDFAVTKWIYVFHTDPNWPTAPASADTGRAHMLTRYTYDSTATPGEQLKSPKRILRFERMIDDRAYHAAGGLDMAADGTLVIGTGDDTNPHDATQHCGQNYAPILWNDRGCDAQKSSSNTASLRGKLLRIKPIPFSDANTPEPGLNSTYTVPVGNLWEKISQPAFNPNWNPAMDTLSKVRKEIFTMGHRNPYHPRIDSKSGWIFTGEVGLDAGSVRADRGPEGREEWNLAVEPGFYGHPYCVATNIPWKKYTSPSTTWSTENYNCAAIQNLSPNNYGIINLPPARASTLSYSQVNGNGDDTPRMGTSGTQETAIGGPMYRYDPTLVSSVKFPPQYEGKVFFFDWSNLDKASFRIISMNPNGTLDSGTAGVKASPITTLAALPNGAYIDMRFGADGAMYLLRNNTGGASYTGFNNAALFRIAYTGTINPSCYTPFVATVGQPAALNDAGRRELRRNLAPALVNGFVNLPIGYKSVELYNLSGRKVWTYRRATADQHEAVQVPMSLAKGVLQARLLP
jgi:cytochrome c